MQDAAAPFWALSEPIDIFFFDCDATLTTLEGIDVLAAMNGVANEVAQITRRCMAETGLTRDAYRTRLQYAQPTKTQIVQLAEQYQAALTPGAYEVIQVLQALHKKIYLLSSGIKAALLPLGHDLGVAPENILAVDIFHDLNGRYQGFDEQSLLVQPFGKQQQIAMLPIHQQRTLLIGDGISDWEARFDVTRFIGYAGLSPKLWVKQHSDFYIDHTRLYALLPLGLTLSEKAYLNERHHTYYRQGLMDILNHHVLIKEPSYVSHPNAR